MADQKISQLNTLTNSTADPTDVLPIVDTSGSETKKITVQNLLRPIDTTFGIVDDGDITKMVQFELSAVTTATTRKLTVPDASTTIVGTDTTQTLTNKTLTSPTVNLGTNATGDIYYRDSGGAFQRLPIGTAGQILDVSSGGIPEWIANPAASDASATVKGVVEMATAAEITAGTATGGTGAKLVIGPDQLALATPVFNGSGLTNVPNSVIYKNGTDTKNAADASTTQNIAHGCGKTPKKVRISAKSNSGGASASDVNSWTSETVYNGTTQSSVSTYGQTSSPYATTAATFSLNASVTTGDQTGVVTFDATNIIITWTKTGSPSGTYTLRWEAEA